MSKSKFEEKNKAREQIQKDVMEFLEKGGKIQKYDSSDNHAAFTRLRPSRHRKGMVYEKNTWNNFTISTGYETRDKQAIPKTVMHRRTVK
jgi:hypothetical protein